MSNWLSYNKDIINTRNINSNLNINNSENLQHMMD